MPPIWAWPVSRSTASGAFISMPLASGASISMPLASDTSISMPLASDTSISMPLASGASISMPLASGASISIPSEPVCAPMSASPAPCANPTNISTSSTTSSSVAGTAMHSSTFCTRSNAFHSSSTAITSTCARARLVLLILYNNSNAPAIELRTTCRF